MTCSTTALTTKSITLTKIVHCTRDFVGIIAEVQHIDGPLKIKYWGVRTPCDPCGIDAYVKPPEISAAPPITLSDYRV